MAEGDYELAAQRLIYARDAEPDNPSVLRLMTLAFWQAGNLAAAGRAVRDWARVEPEPPGAASLRRAHLRGHGRDRPRRRGRRRASPRARRPTRTPGSASAACACGCCDREARASTRSSARARSRRASRACSTSRSPTTSPATSAARSPPPSRRRCSTPTARAAWSRYAHALARTDRITEAIAASRARAAARRRRRRGRRAARAPARRPGRGSCQPHRLRGCPPPAPTSSSPHSSRSGCTPSSAFRASTTSPPGRRCASRRSA